MTFISTCNVPELLSKSTTKESAIFCDDWHDNHKELSFTLIKPVHPEAWCVLFRWYPVKLQMWGILFECPTKHSFLTSTLYWNENFCLIFVGVGWDMWLSPFFICDLFAVILVLLLMCVKIKKTLLGEANVKETVDWSKSLKLEGIY